MNYTESREQGTIAGYLKKHHPNIEFETVEREGKRTPRAQMLIKKLNSRSGWPDTRIYASRGDFSSLMIENKANGTKLFQARLNRFTNRHYEEQYKCHQALIAAGHYVVFGIGISATIEIIERYLSGNPLPLPVYDYVSWDLEQSTDADTFFKERGL